MRQFENQEHWDSVANHYQQTAHPFTALFAEAALARVTLTPQSHVLDVAAGTGVVAQRASAMPLATSASAST